LRRDGDKHVALVLPTPPIKKAPSKFSQSAIDEGSDILADALNMSGVITMFDDDDQYVSDIEVSQEADQEVCQEADPSPVEHSNFMCQNTSANSSNVDVVTLEQVSIGSMYLPPGRVVSIQISNGLSALNDIAPSEGY
jgi:hypothetical protein